MAGPGARLREGAQAKASRPMNEAADFELRDTPRGRTAVLSGNWTAVDMGLASERLSEALKGGGPVAIDMNGVGRCDTSGLPDSPHEVRTRSNCLTTATTAAIVL